MSFSEFTQNDYELIAREYAGLKEAARKRCSGPEELDIIQKAYEFANEAHKNVRRRSGEPYMLHPIAVAKIVVSKIGLGCKSIVAALLHDVVEDTDYTVKEIQVLFGDKVASLVDGLTKIKNVLDNQDKNATDEEYYKSLQAENFKRILLTLNDDVRVVLIKLADRLHNCRTIEYMPEYKRDKILSETMFVFIPLAHRLGLYEVKSEMENIWLRFKEPDVYNEINTMVNRDVSAKGKDIELFVDTINDSLSKAGFCFEVKKRIKTPYSIWHKMKTKNVTFEQVYDLYAVRIIFDARASSKEQEREQCYHIFTIITGIFRYKPDRIRDWVKHPKSNGYEALHCTLMSNNGLWIEVQIRTKRMDDIAEKGIAAHWAYKREGFDKENEMDRWLGKVKEIIVSPDVNALELLDIIHNDLITNDIIVFTPRGEQKSIAKGATALDFAYLIHTHIGNKAIAAKVNMKLVPLNYVLKSGDSVEIITAENEVPKIEWMSFLFTRHAKNLVMDYFRASKDIFVKQGREIIENELLSRSLVLNEKIRRLIVAGTAVQNFEEACFRLGVGMTKFSTIEAAADIDSLAKTVVKHHSSSGSSKWKKFFPWLKDSDADAVIKPLEELSDKTSFFINSPSDPHRYIISKCCNPIAGDPVIGFLSPEGVVMVHKKTCPRAESMASKYGDRILMPKWSDSSDQSFLVRIYIKAVDRMGLLNEITRDISLVMGVNMTKLDLSAVQGIFEGKIDLYVQNKDVLSLLIKHLSGIRGMQEVQRLEL